VADTTTAEAAPVATATHAVVVAATATHVVAVAVTAAHVHGAVASNVTLLTALVAVGVALTIGAVVATTTTTTTGIRVGAIPTDVTILLAAVALFVAGINRSTGRAASRTFTADMASLTAVVAFHTARTLVTLGWAVTDTVTWLTTVVASLLLGVVGIHSFEMACAECC